VVGRRPGAGHQRAERPVPVRRRRAARGIRRPRPDRVRVDGRRPAAAQPPPHRGRRRHRLPAVLRRGLPEQQGRVARADRTHRAPLHGGPVPHPHSGGVADDRRHRRRCARRRSRADPAPGGVHPGQPGRDRAGHPVRRLQRRSVRAPRAVRLPGERARRSGGPGPDHGCRGCGSPRRHQRERRRRDLLVPGRASEPPGRRPGAIRRHGGTAGLPLRLSGGALQPAPGERGGRDRAVGTRPGHVRPLRHPGRDRHHPAGLPGGRRYCGARGHAAECDLPADHERSGRRRGEVHPDRQDEQRPAPQPEHPDARRRVRGHQAGLRAPAASPARPRRRAVPGAVRHRGRRPLGR